MIIMMIILIFVMMPFYLIMLRGAKMRTIGMPGVAEWIMWIHPTWFTVRIVAKVRIILTPVFIMPNYIAGEDQNGLGRIEVTLHGDSVALKVTRMPKVCALPVHIKGFFSLAPLLSNNLLIQR